MRTATVEAHVTSVRARHPAARSESEEETASRRTAATRAAPAALCLPEAAHHPSGLTTRPARAAKALRCASARELARASTGPGTAEDARGTAKVATRIEAIASDWRRNLPPVGPGHIRSGSWESAKPWKLTRRAVGARTARALAIGGSAAGCHADHGRERHDRGSSSRGSVAVSLARFRRALVASPLAGGEFLSANRGGPDLACWTTAAVEHHALLRTSLLWTTLLPTMIAVGRGRSIAVVAEPRASVAAALPRRATVVSRLAPRAAGPAARAIPIVAPTGGRTVLTPLLAVPIRKAVERTGRKPPGVHSTGWSIRKPAGTQENRHAANHAR